ncbi:hypothetical protein ACHQM5_005757 [Ranunculus cassubicifolius]
MAGLGSSFLFFLSIFYFSTVFSRTLEPIPCTSILDVSASNKKTEEFLSFSPATVDEKLEESKHSNSSFTFKLYSRDTFHKSSFKTYRDLILHRLKRDSVRVNFLINKFNFSFEQKNSSELNPMDLEAPLISGLSKGSGEYFVRFGFGTPARQFYTAIDTGSDISWIQCKPCVNCYDQNDPIFDPATSSSYRQLTCNSPQCNQLPLSRCTSTGTCEYRVAYGDGSVTIGDFATETLTFGDSAINNVGIGCGHDNEGLFTASAGLFGLGRGSLSFPAQIKSSAFSYCLVDKDSTSASTIEFGPSTLSNGAVTGSLLQNTRRRTFYYVGLTGISVGGRMLPISPSSFAIDASGNGGVIVDSGTAVTRFSTEVYNVLRDEFVKGTTTLTSAAGFSLFDTCYDLSSQTAVEVPTVALHFGTNAWNLPAKNYMLPVGNKIYCFAFATVSGVSIIGNVQQQGTRVSFNVGRSLIGFSPNNC